jgi:CHAT domain-containing protein/tetratricopeptide (TPR) repeat protein
VVIRPVDRHLDSDELDALLSSHVPGDAGHLSEQEVREAQRHVEYCQDCDRKLQMHRSAQNLIYQRTTGKPAKALNCPDESEWVRIVAGLVEEAEAKERMKHAAQCGHCGPLLKVAAETLSDETSPDEEAVLANLSSARSDWQAQMAETLRSEGRPRRVSLSSPSFWKTLFYWPRFAFAIGALVTVVAAGWIGVQLLRPASAEQLLAQAYAERRTIDVRIPGAVYAPLRVERAGSDSNFDKPEALLKAEALISENLRKHPSDPVWLDAKGRAELLDGEYDNAIKTLQRGFEANPDSAQLMADLGAAYFVRAKSTNRPIDYGTAIEFLGKALTKDPNDPIALFNRALASEQMFLYSQAVDDWEHYLRLDPRGQWSDEARRRLAAVEERLQRHDRSAMEPLLTPKEIAAGEFNEVALKNKIDDRIEEYLHVAVTDWLPQAFVLNSSSTSNDATTALQALSSVLVEQHNDAWLADLLNQPHGAPFPAGIRLLSQALIADDSGDYSAAHRSAHRAAQLLAVNPAAELRATAEEVYSDHLLWQGRACILLLTRLAEPVRRRSYGWLRGQLSLEESNCANLVGDLGTYESAITRGIKEAQTFHYTALFVRGLGFEALSAASLGNDSKSFSLAVEGLALFWSRHIDLTKGYNLYTDLDAAAGDLAEHNLQVTLWREATALLDHDPDTVKRAMAHRWYGMAAYLASNPKLAASEFTKANVLFAASPQTPATIRDHLDAEVWQAKAEVLQGDLEQAASRLQQIEPSLYNAPSFDPEIGYYSAAAEIAMRRADPASTESAMRSAVFLAEWALRTFSSDEARRQWSEQTRDVYRSAVEWRFRQGDANSALELWEWYRGADSRAGKAQGTGPEQDAATTAPPDPRNAPPLPTPAVVANALPLLRDVTVISYGTFFDGVAIWAYDDRGIISYWRETPPQHVRDLAVKLDRLCADPSSYLPELRTTARALYDLLIKPVEERLDLRRTLLFEPDDSLTALPWDSLVDESGRYLGLRFATAVTPGVYRTKRLRAATSIGPTSAALVVSVPVAPGLAPLGDAENEAQAVAAMFSSARLLQNAEATLTGIRADIRESSVFHFAGHAIASSQRNGLLLAEGDPVTNSPVLIGEHDFASRDVQKLELAVLSACNTASETENSNAGTEGLGEALLRAGVPHVIASRWAVDSFETASLMRTFYVSLLAGSSPAGALRRARVALASQPASVHPYYWSAFALWGTS